MTALFADTFYRHGSLRSAADVGGYSKNVFTLATTFMSRRRRRDLPYLTQEERHDL